MPFADDFIVEAIRLIELLGAAGDETPAAGVVLNLHQTNRGLYRFRLSTSRGGQTCALPQRRMPAHIHVYAKEPERRPHYLDDFVFEGDPHMTAAYREHQELRSESGILQLMPSADGEWQGHRAINLEW